MNFKTAIAAAILAGSFSAPASSWAISVFSDNGTVAQVTETVTDFRAALGGGAANTGAANFATGRREINWDGVPDSSSDPNLIANNFFNTGSGGRARGLEFHNSGPDKFQVSSNTASGEPIGFGSASDFVPFSPERMFAPIDSLTTEITFFDPIRPTVRATTNAFGAVFEDVETRGGKMAFYGVGGDLLLSVDIARGGSGALSFTGATFESAVIYKVVINVGNAVLRQDGTFGEGSDGVVMDDFIYGEPVPVPEPSTYAMFGLGLAALAFARRRSKA